ncbi:peptidoglycan bridge formation glycyltransferase FemA/FemB family protein [Helicobacter pullorum]|uniref:peptidoglycan bridge formation glycyltransferase FemA/FemB family protein n=1 Tax=Helicobacter pullorum TaxID=35818 RepID=UPI000B29AA5E|nr:peptidoglycan bridge formation glycyltransferase FemA/FemB family protein [Helicobacter pullorum]
MQILELEAQLSIAYSQFLNQCSGSMIYYSLPYKCLLEDFLKCNSRYLVVYDNGKIHGVLPLMYRKGKYGEILNSLPFYGSHGGILATNDDAYDLLIEYYNSIVGNYASANYISNPLVKYDGAKKPVYDFLDKRIGQWTFLVEQNELIKSFDSSATRNIYKAQCKNIEIIKTDSIEFLYKTHKDNISQLNGVYKEKEFFEKISKNFGSENYAIYIALYDKIPIAALLLFYFGEIVEYYTPATLFEYRTLQALPLLIFNAMNEAFEKGYKMWNWGGTWKSQEGVYRFKKKFGAKEREYKYYVKINNKEILDASREELLKEYPYFYVIPFEKLNRV